MTDLSVNLLKQSFSNPVWIGSGTITETKERVSSFIETSIGAVVPRTTRMIVSPERKTHPSYHLDISRDGGYMRNCEWTGKNIEYWEDKLQDFANSKKVIFSVSGRKIDDCVRTCKIIDSYNFPFIEINISCAHSNEAHGYINRSKKHVEKLVTKIKHNIRTPIAIKLGHSDFLLDLARVAEKAGADALVAINTFGPVIDFDIEKGLPKLKLGIAGGKGGLSGKPIFLIALTDVSILSRELNIPIIACGGVNSAKDVIKMIMAGADAVQIYSAFHINGKARNEYISNIINDIEKWMKDNSYKEISEIKGILNNFLNDEHQMKIKKPVHRDDLCSSCFFCEDICLQGAISRRDKKIIINNKKCIGCGACASVCPNNSLR